MDPLPLSNDDYITAAKRDVARERRRLAAATSTASHELAVRMARGLGWEAGLAGEDDGEVCEALHILMNAVCTHQDVDEVATAGGLTSRYEVTKAAARRFRPLVKALFPRSVKSKRAPTVKPKRTPICMSRYMPRDGDYDGAVARACEDIRSVTSGTRATQVYWRAYYIGRLVGGGGLSLHPAREDLVAAAQSVGLEEDVAAQQVDRGLTEGATRPCW